MTPNTNKPSGQVARTERAIRTIRQRIFDMPPERQERATMAIGVLKARLAPVWANYRHSRSDYHWMYAAE